MPRVTQDHLDARRRQILDAARRCFVRNGFHATSMHDVLEEANLSAGAVYRYFAGKDDIVVAIATDLLADVAAAFEAAGEPEAPPTLDAVLGRVLATLERLDATQDLSRLALQVWGEALRSPALAERATETFTVLRRLLVGVIEADQDRGLIARDVPSEDIAPLLAGLLPGFMVQRALLGDVDAETFRHALRALLTTNRPEVTHDR